MVKSLRLLILEDNPVDAELVQFELQEAGLDFTAKVVVTEEDFVRELQEFSPDLILSDYDLPRYNGALALAESKRRCPDIPFILVTGAVTEDRAIEILTQGAKDYVLKTRLQQRLAPAVRRALAEADEHRARKQAEAQLREAYRTLERQVAERTSELQESRERLGLALTSSRMGTFEWDIVKNRRYFDDSVYLLLGIKPENFSGTAEEFFQVIHPDDRHVVQTALNKAIEQDVPYETEYRALWRDGSVHHIAARGKVQRDNAGRPLRLLGVCWEITERRRTEEKLHRQAELLNLSSEAIFMWELGGAIIYWSHGAQRLYGYSSEEALGRVSYDLLKTKHPQGFDYIKTMLIRDTTWTGELSHITKDGRTVRVESRHQLIEDELGRKIVLETTRDITARKQAEEELNRQREWLRVTLASIGDAVITTDAAGRVTFMNAVAGALTGWSLHEASARPVTKVFNIINEHSRQAVVSPVTRVLNEGVIVGLANHTLLVRRDGTEVPIDDSGAPIREVDGKTLGVVLVFRDITERKRAQEALRRSEEWYHTLFNTLIEGFCIIEMVFDAEGRPVDYRFLEVNPAFEEQTGLHAAQGKLMRDLAPDHEAHWFEIYGKIALTGEPARFENEAKALNRWFEVSAFRVGGPESRKVAILFNDITKRKHAQEALRRSEILYRELVQNANSAIIRWRKDGTITFFNEFAQNFFGYQESEVIGKHVNIIIPEQESSGIDLSKLARSIVDHPEHYVNNINENIRKDGSRVWMTWINRPILDESGQVTEILAVGSDITERKQAEFQREDALEALRKNEHRYRELFNSMQEGFYIAQIIYDEDGKPQDYIYLDINPVFERIMGLSRDQVIGKRLKELTPNVSSNWLHIIKRVALSGEPVYSEFYSKSFHRYFKATAYRPFEGQLAVLVDDITSRKQAEEKESQQNKIVEGINRIFREAITCETEEQLGDVCLDVIQALTGSGIGFIGEIGLDGCFFNITISSSGREACSMTDQTGHRRTPGSFKIHGLYGRVIEDGKSLIVNAPAAHPESIGIPEGHPPLTAFLGTPLIRDGKTIGLIAVGNREGGYTPEQQHTLEALAPAVLQALLKKRTEVELQTSETRFRAFFENAEVGTAELSLDGHFLQVNKRLCQMTGYSAEELLRMTPADLSPPEDDQHNQEIMDAYLHGPISTFDMERRCRRKNGNIIWVQIAAATIRDANAEPLHSAVVIIDITERRRAEFELQNRTAQLANANKELESFSYSVSHDLKAPLRAIEGYSRMLVKKYGSTLDEDATRMLSVIHSSTEMMEVLINDLLSFSRVASNAMVLSEIDMDKLVSEVWDEIRQANKERKLKLKITKMLPGYGDLNLIRQVLINLISNAVKFTKDRKQGIVEISSYKESDKNVYCFKDNGAGFDMAYYNKLFGVFQRLHSHEEYEGTGVGLAIVQRIVQRHGGRVWAEGEVDKGATFCFTLPRK
jgi:PAS domain S-box-containing protein